MTARAGDDTVVINQRLPTRLAGSVIDQYGRRLKADTAGGNALSAPGTTVGPTANVGYTAEYFFYRAQ